ncbi:TetR/AcrR family transcriptional regulator [Amycolatopsis taiwanensis]|uniref:TetR family transcriptional regulator n=1 Tax=Amycolatopsis taiwanensis TaxID=342230 RepID=A0A9W6R938_9PSEU|nr:TetR/AcrR family transcriptional regulator [Amycolatopsis taiwanensis]GLY71476.1 TetR family transcriptional regulator [Amycolatopsis taiwanensis]
MVADPDTPLRADARRNRDQIIAAAKQVFLDQGPDVPMEVIARRAGVGVGTLYRRFPDRESLILAVSRRNFEEVVTEARAAAAEEPTAWAAIVRLLQRSRGLKLSVQLAVLSPLARAILRDDETTQEFRAEIMLILDELVRGAQAEGSMRRDVGAGDVAVLCSLLLMDLPLEDLSDLVLDRALAVMIDGLRATSQSPLPGRPITGEDLRIR